MYFLISLSPKDLPRTKQANKSGRKESSTLELRGASSTTFDSRGSGHGGSGGRRPPLAGSSLAKPIPAAVTVTCDVMRRQENAKEISTLKSHKCWGACGNTNADIHVLSHSHSITYTVYLSVSLFVPPSFSLLLPSLTLIHTHTLTHGHLLHLSWWSNYHKT